MTLKHWQIFGAFMLYLLLLVLFLNATGIQTTRVVDGLLFSLIPTTIYPVILSLGMNKLRAGETPTPVWIRSFMIALIFWIVAFLAYQFVDQERRVLKVVLGLISLGAFFQFAKYPIKEMRFVELRREPGFWEYIADIFQVLCWPLCIWWLQPRANKVAERLLQRISTEGN